jgi:hypothetical protein
MGKVRQAEAVCRDWWPLIGQKGTTSLNPMTAQGGDVR